MQGMHAPTDFIIEPLPNHLFTRDTSCWVYGGVSINPMAKPARQRETNHVRAIYRWHPTFAGQDFIKYFGDEEKINYDNSTIEGGDVLVLGRGGGWRRYRSSRGSLVRRVDRLRWSERAL